MFLAAKAALLADPALIDRFLSGYQLDSFTRPILEALHRGADSSFVATGYLLLPSGLIATREEALPGAHQRVLVPRQRALLTDILHALHSAPAAGHPGRQRTLDAARRHFFWPGMRKDVISYVTSCPTCQRVKPSSTATSPPLHPLEPSFDRWSAVSLDFKTGLPPSHGLDAVMAVTCRFSRRVRLVPLRSTASASDVAILFIDHIVKLHGLPDTLISDRDPKFVSAFWQELWAALGTRLRTSTANSPQTDGSSERAIRSFRSVLSATLAEQGGEWLDRLPHTEMALNLAVHSATGLSPFEADIGRVPRSALDVLLPPSAPTAAKDLQKHLSDITQTVSESALAARTVQARAADRRGRRPISFHTGQQVLVHRDALRDPASDSLPPVFRTAYHGPFEVVEMVTPHAARLLLPPEARAHDVINVRFLRPFRHDEWPDRQRPPPPDDNGEFSVAGVARHRGSRKRPGSLRFLTLWTGFDEPTWEPVTAFFSNGTWTSHFLRYHRKHARSLPSLDALADACAG